MITRLMQSLFMRWVLLCLGVLVLTSCTTAPIAPREKTDTALVPQRVTTFEGSPAAKTYTRRTIEDVFGDRAQSLNRYVTAQTNIFEFKDARLAKQLQQKWQT